MARRARLEQTQRIQLHQPLRQHAELSGPVHRVGVVGGGDHLARHLADAPVAVHGGGAQHLERLRLGHLAGPHQDALGPVDELALVEAAAQVGEVAAQPRLGGEAGPGDLDHGPQPLRRVAVDDVGVDARADGALDLGRVRVLGEDDHRPRLGDGEALEGVEQVVVGGGFLADDEVGCQPRHFAHQGVAPDRTKDVNPGRAQVGDQVDRPRRRALDDERARHEGPAAGRSVLKVMGLSLQGANHR